MVLYETGICLNIKFRYNTSYIFYKRGNRKMAFKYIIFIKLFLIE